MGRRFKNILGLSTYNAWIRRTPVVSDEYHIRRDWLTDWLFFLKTVKWPIFNDEFWPHGSLSQKKSFTNLRDRGLGYHYKKYQPPISIFTLCGIATEKRQIFFKWSNDLSSAMNFGHRGRSHKKKMFLFLLLQLHKCKNWDRRLIFLVVIAKNPISTIYKTAFLWHGPLGPIIIAEVESFDRFSKNYPYD